MPLAEAGGLIEKLVPGGQFPALMRAILPGALATLTIYPFTGWPFALMDPDGKLNWARLLIIIGMTIGLGALISVLSGELYKVYEGRILWPRWLCEAGIRRESARAKRLYELAESQRQQKLDNDYNETWYQLRIYPLSVTNGLPHADRPTRLGNILSGYEQYPLNRYGMHSVFYWPRLWLQLEKEKKEEIDGSWSVADGFLGLSAVSFAGFAIWVTAAAFAMFENHLSKHLPMGRADFTFLCSLGWLLAGYAFYRLSLPFHRANGEVFKALFDLYRDKIRTMTKLTPGEIRAWRSAWGYLQYCRIGCPNPECARLTPLVSGRCLYCGTDIEPQLQRLERSGEFCKEGNMSQQDDNAPPQNKPAPPQQTVIPVAGPVSVITGVTQPPSPQNPKGETGGALGVTVVGTSPSSASNPPPGPSAPGATPPDLGGWPSAPGPMGTLPGSQPVQPSGPASSGSDDHEADDDHEGGDDHGGDD
jgi:hypothetical protein